MLFLEMIQPLINIPGPSVPPGGDRVMVVVSWVSWAFAIAGVLGLIGVAVAMFFSNRAGNGAPEHAGKLGMVFGGLIIGGSAAGLVSALL